MNSVKLLLIVATLFWVADVDARKKLKQNLGVDYQFQETQVYTLDGKKSKLSELWKEKPVLLITGSLSCPPTRHSLGATTKLMKKFEGKINIALLYVIDAHPKGDISPYSGDEWIPRENFADNILIPQPKELSQRNDRAKELNMLLGLEVPVLVDNMDNLNWKNLGKLPNAGILIDTNGKVIAKQKWFKANKMAKRLNKYFERYPGN